MSPALLADVEAGAQGGSPAAPVLVVVCGDTRLGDRRVLEASVFPAIQNLLLAATALGLGSSLTTLPLVFGGELAVDRRAARRRCFPWRSSPWAGRRARCRHPGACPWREKAHRETFGSPW